jgi:hypothetical protein
VCRCVCVCVCVYVCVCVCVDEYVCVRFQGVRGVCSYVNSADSAFANPL